MTREEQILRLFSAAEQAQMHLEAVLSIPDREQADFTAVAAKLREAGRMAMCGSLDADELVLTQEREEFASWLGGER